jgi:dipeptidyl aminopeptidase/acylaminoacyl peptidase
LIVRSGPKFIAVVIVAAFTLGSNPVIARPQSGLPLGDTRLTHRERSFGFDTPYHLLDMSDSGRYVAFSWIRGRTGWLGVIDLEQRSLRLLAEEYGPDDAEFSPDETEIAFVNNSKLWIVNISGDAVVEVAPVHFKSKLWWLDDGRLAYVDPDRRLVVQQPTADPEPTPLRIPDPAGRDDLVDNVSVSPDGSRALYARSCRPWLVDLVTGEEAALAPRPKKKWFGYAIPPHAWAPDGAHLLVQRVAAFKCAQPSGPGGRDILYTGAGERIGDVLGADEDLSHGHGVSWSTDSRWLFVTVQPTGTQVSGLQELWAVDLVNRNRSLLFPARVASHAFADDNGRVVVSRFHTTSVLRADGALISGTLEP